MIVFGEEAVGASIAFSVVQQGMIDGVLVEVHGMVCVRSSLSLYVKCCWCND